MILLPMYVHPLEDPVAWSILAGLGARATAIVNVHDGPGEHRDSSYEVATAALRAAGVGMIGYVDLAYGERPCRDVWRDIEGWERYPVSGLFLDRTPAGAPGLDGVARAVSSAGRPVVLNPGTRPHSEYAGLAAAVCTFEGPWSSYRAPDPWLDWLDRDWPNAAHLVYGIPPARLDEAEALLRSRVSCGLATDLDAPAPYRGLPSRLRGPATSAR